jgi:hypothetical protein
MLSPVQVSGFRRTCPEPPRIPSFLSLIRSLSGFSQLPAGFKSAIADTILNKMRKSSMQKSVLFLFMVMLLPAGICRGEDSSGQSNNTAAAAAPAPSAALAASETDTLIDSSIGKLKKIFALKDVIKDIPDNMIAGIRFDKKQRLYVATYGIGKFEAWTIADKPVYRVETDGTVSVFASLKCGILGILGIDEANSVYVTTTNDLNAEAGTDIVKITEDGKASTFSQGFKQPCSGVFDRAGNMYLVDAQYKKIYKLTPQGEKSIISDLNQSALSTGLLFHGMAFDSSFSTCYLVGYSAGYGKVLKCSVDKDWKMGPLQTVCTLPSPKFAWVDKSGNVYVNYDVNRIAKIFPDGTYRGFYDALYGNVLDDFNRAIYILSKECQLYRIVEIDSTTNVPPDPKENAAPRIIGFSVERDSLSSGGYVARARVEDETLCTANLFLLHDGKSDTLLLTRDSRDSTLYSLRIDGYAWGDSLTAWLKIADDQGLSTVSDTLGFRFAPFVAGDLDGDGGVDIFDLLAMLRILSGSAQPSAGELCTGDLDRSGKINIFDQLALLKRLAAA